ncbi:MAG: hypothetical protein ABIH21_03765 [Patescibacteria group bacterium]
MDISIHMQEVLEQIAKNRMQPREIKKLAWIVAALGVTIIGVLLNMTLLWVLLLISISMAARGEIELLTKYWSLGVIGNDAWLWIAEDRDPDPIVGITFLKRGSKPVFTEVKNCRPGHLLRLPLGGWFRKKSGDHFLFWTSWIVDRNDMRRAVDVELRPVNGWSRIKINGRFKDPWVGQIVRFTYNQKGENGQFALNATEALRYVSFGHLHRDAGSVISSLMQLAQMYRKDCVKSAEKILHITASAKQERADRISDLRLTAERIQATTRFSKSKDGKSIREDLEAQVADLEQYPDPTVPSEPAQTSSAA